MNIILKWHYNWIWTTVSIVTKNYKGKTFPQRKFGRILFPMKLKIEHWNELRWKERYLAGKKALVNFFFSKQMGRLLIHQYSPVALLWPLYFGGKPRLARLRQTDNCCLVLSRKSFSNLSKSHPIESRWSGPGGRYLKPATDFVVLFVLLLQ